MRPNFYAIFEVVKRKKFLPAFLQNHYIFASSVYIMEVQMRLAPINEIFKNIIAPTIKLIHIQSHINVKGSENLSQLMHSGIFAMVLCFHFF